MKFLLLAALAVGLAYSASAQVACGPDSRGQCDAYGGLISFDGVEAPTCTPGTSTPTPEDPVGHALFKPVKIGNRWVFCTPDGHPFISMNVSVPDPGNQVRDCQTNTDNANQADLVWTLYSGTPGVDGIYKTSVKWRVDTVWQDTTWYALLAGSGLTKVSSVAAMTAGTWFQSIPAGGTCDEITPCDLYVFTKNLGTAVQGTSPGGPDNPSRVMNYPQDARLILNAKYGNPAYSANAANQELRRFRHWNFNSLGQNSTFPNMWPFGGNYPPDIKFPLIVVWKPGQYSSVNLYGYLPLGGMVKDGIDAMNYGNWSGWTGGGSYDVFDPSLKQELQTQLADPGSGNNLRLQQPYMMAVTVEDSDFVEGMKSGPDFVAGDTAAQSGITVLETSPMQTGTDGTRWNGYKVVYTPPYFYSKMWHEAGHATCGIANPCSLRDYLEEKYTTIAALNTAWGTSGAYTSFNSTGTCVGWDSTTTGKLCPAPAGTNTTTAETIGTGDGSTTAFTYTLAHYPVSPFSVQVLVNGAAAIFDCPWLRCSTAGTNVGFLKSPTSLMESSAATWSGGTATYTFKRGLVQPSVGSKITTTGFSPAGYNQAGAVVTASSDKTVSIAIADPGASSATTKGSGTLAVLTTPTVSSNSINYSTGAVKLTFSSPPPAGAAITIRYVYGGWMAGGTGLIDEDGRSTHTWIPRTNAWCMTGPDPDFTRDYSCTGETGTNHKALPAIAFQITKLEVDNPEPGKTLVTITPPSTGARTLHSGQQVYLTGHALGACANDPDEGGTPVTITNASDTATTFSIPTPTGCTSATPTPTTTLHGNSRIFDAWVTAAQGYDLDLWAAQFVAKWAKTNHDVLHNTTSCSVTNGWSCVSTNIPYIGLDNYSGYASRRVIQGSAPYQDAAYTGLGDWYKEPIHQPTERNNAYQYWTHYLGDQPMLQSTMVIVAQQDSAMACHGGTGTIGVTTQGDRAAHYYDSINYELTTLGASGSYPLIAFNWWIWWDFASERTNEGLMTLHDNAYDGIEAVQTKGTAVCESTANGGYYTTVDGYRCGGENKTYGDVLYGTTNGGKGVSQANALWLPLVAALGGTPTAASPAFLPVAGTYTSTQNVAISSTTSGATVCYTTDGSTPTADGAGTCTHGTTYSGTVSVAASQTLKAIASASGYSDSSVASAAYVINLPGASVSTTMKGVKVKGVKVQ